LKRGIVPETGVLEAIPSLKTVLTPYASDAGPRYMSGAYSTPGLNGLFEQDVAITLTIIIADNDENSDRVFIVIVKPP
jgi:hypothetical protein